MKLQWDEDKNRENHSKHGVSLEQAGALFLSGNDYLEVFDAAHSIEEDRFIAIGPIVEGLVVVVWTERDEDVLRIISARWATPREQSMYHAAMERTHE